MTSEPYCPEPPLDWDREHTTTEPQEQFCRECANTADQDDGLCRFCRMGAEEYIRYLAVWTEERKQR